MPTLEENQAHLIRANLSLAILVIGLLAILAILIFAWRKSTFREYLIAVAPGIPSLAMLTVNPFLGLLSLGLGVHVGKLQRLKLTLPTILFAALLLRLPLMFQSFWYDEAFTERMTTLSIQGLIPAIEADTHPPVYYSLIWLWSKVFGHSEFTLRVPSLIFGLIGIVLLYRLVRAMGLSERIALIAAALMAVTPASLYYATEARSYALLTCAVFGAILCILEDRPLGFIVCTALTGWFHNLGLFYVPALALAAVVYRPKLHLGLNWNLSSPIIPPHRWVQVDASGIFWIRRNYLSRWLGYAGTACLFACFWLPLTIQQSQGISNGFWISFNAGTPFTVFTLNSMYLPQDFIIPVLLPVILLTLAGFWIARRGVFSTAQGTVLLIVLCTPLAIAVLTSVLWAPVFLSRVFLPLTLLSLVPLAYAINKYWDWLPTVAVPLFLSGLIVFYGSVNLLRPDLRAIVNKDCQGTDAMYYTAVDTALTLAPYWQGKSLTWTGGVDRGLTFGVDQLPLFNLESGDISNFAGKTVCSVYVLTPRTLQTERDYITDLTVKYPYTVIEHAIHDELQVWVYHFEV